MGQLINKIKIIDSNLNKIKQIYGTTKEPTCISSF